MDYCIIHALMIDKSTFKLSCGLSVSYSVCGLLVPEVYQMAVNLFVRVARMNEYCWQVVLASYDFFCQYHRGMSVLEYTIESIYW